MEQFGERTLRYRPSVRSHSKSHDDPHSKSRDNPGGVPVGQNHKCISLSCGVHFQEESMFTGGNVFSMHHHYQTKAVSKIVQLQIRKQPMRGSLIMTTTTTIEVVDAKIREFFCRKRRMLTHPTSKDIFQFASHTSFSLEAARIIASFLALGFMMVLV
jgi:hypothetical protein